MNLTPHGPGFSFLDAFEVARQRRDQVDEVGVALVHRLVRHCGYLATGGEPVAFTVLFGDLLVQPTDAFRPVGVGLGGAVAHGVDDGGQAGLADQGAVTGEALDQKQRLEGVRGQ